MLRYVLKDKVFLLIDNFKTDDDDYLKNNIRDYSNNQSHVSLEPFYEKDAEGNLTLAENNLYSKAYEKGYRNVKVTYIFRKGVLQRIELNNPKEKIADRYYALYQALRISLSLCPVDIEASFADTINCLGYRTRGKY